MKYDFKTRVNRKEQGSIKWEDMFNKKENIKDKIIPLSIADMEFKNAPEIIEGLKKYLDKTILGYTMATKKYKKAVCYWMKKRHNFEIQEDWIINTVGVVSAFFNAIQEFTEEGDGIIIMTPVYYPFFNAIKSQNRKLVDCPLIEKNGKYSIDYSLFDKLSQEPKNKILLFCSPHNPVGRVWSKKELKKVSDIILKNNLMLLSDEIHFDMIMPNNQHTVFQTIDDELAERTITFTAPSKTFNLAGMGISNIIIKNKNLRRKFIDCLNRNCSTPFIALGYNACEIAYTQCEEWLNQCLEVIYKNQKIIIDFFEKNYPEIKVFKNEGTYLLWVDFRALNMKPKDLEKFMIEEADLFLDEGYIFGKNGEGFERINLAAPSFVIKEALQRLDYALKNYNHS